MVNLNADRNLPPDSTPWGKNIERRLHDLERDRRLEESDARNTARVLNNTIDRLNLGRSTKLMGSSGTPYTDFTAPLLPEDGPGYDPATLETYPLTNNSPGYHLALVSAVIRGRHLLRDSEPGDFTVDSLICTVSLATDSEPKIWSWTTYPWIHRRPGSVPTWEFEEHRIFGAGLIYIPSSANALSLNMENFWSPTQGQISEGTVMRADNLQVILTN